MAALTTKTKAERLGDAMLQVACAAPLGIAGAFLVLGHPPAGTPIAAVLSVLVVATLLAWGALAFMAQIGTKAIGEDFALEPSFGNFVRGIVMFPLAVIGGAYVLLTPIVFGVVVIGALLWLVRGH